MKNLIVLLIAVAIFMTPVVTMASEKSKAQNIITITIHISVTEGLKMYYKGERYYSSTPVSIHAGEIVKLKYICDDCQLKKGLFFKETFESMHQFTVTKTDKDSGLVTDLYHTPPIGGPKSGLPTIHEYQFTVDAETKEIGTHCHIFCLGMSRMESEKVVLKVAKVCN